MSFIKKTRCNQPVGKGPFDLTSTRSFSRLALSGWVDDSGLERRRGEEEERLGGRVQVSLTALQSCNLGTLFPKNFPLNLV